jgi:uncharacterized membrane protein
MVYQLIYVNSNFEQVSALKNAVDKSGQSAGVSLVALLIPVFPVNP